MLLAAIKTLASVRRMNRLVVQIDVAENQVNVVNP
jgi:hypothetical protein